MTHDKPARNAARSCRMAVLAAMAAASIAACAAARNGPPALAAPPTAPAPPDIAARTTPDTGGTTRLRPRHGPWFEDGRVPGGVTVFDRAYPAVTRLNPELLAALRRATRDAARDGVRLYVDSGWRSREYQEQLLRAAVAKYGSRERAARWVATADTSAHTRGKAVDIGPPRARVWLSLHGTRYGLCRVYRNEPWHYELARAAAARHACPPVFADPAHDPRMRP